jgi:hypothetical protein
MELPSGGSLRDVVYVAAIVVLYGIISISLTLNAISPLIDNEAGANPEDYGRVRGVVFGVAIFEWPWGNTLSYKDGRFRATRSLERWYLPDVKRSGG